MDGEQAIGMNTNVEHVGERWLMTASELYDEVVFKTNSFGNQPAPEYYVAFAIGGFFSVLGILMWAKRVYDCKKELEELNVPFTGKIRLRAMISRAIDNDSTTYTVTSFSAFSFLFLGGLQLDYDHTLYAMIISYALFSLGDSARILLAVGSANSLSDIVHTSHMVHSQLTTETTVLNPTNVYEDLGRNKTVVIMVFITQFLLISFVFVDLVQSHTTSCLDGSAGCPVVGTMTSWGFYVLGIFMACVYLLGPKTAFGQSEQNPAYWIQLLIAAKHSGAKVTWFDPVASKEKERNLSPNDVRLWFRFFMSYLINGVGFHVLVHALPVQVASQSSLTGVVFRAVGMMYLVDLDDTAGYALTISEEPLESDEKVDDTGDAEKPSVFTSFSSLPISADASPGSNGQPFSSVRANEMAVEAEKIIQEAKAKLDALSRGGYSSNPNIKPHHGDALAAGAVLLAGEIANAPNEVEDYDDTPQMTQDSPGDIEGRSAPSTNKD